VQAVRLGDVDCATNGVIDEGNALGRLDVAAVGLPRHDAGWRRVGGSASTVLGGVDCATKGMAAEGSALGRPEVAAVGLPRRDAGWC
jgi:hypothetical protein